MTKKNITRSAAWMLIIAAPLVLSACFTEQPVMTSDALDLPAKPYDYFGTSPQLGTLGRVLFYDKHLSANNSVSCASCHQQSAGFADSRRFSLGFDNNKTKRNSMSIQNLRNFDQSLVLFWDGRQNDLGRMVMEPITHPVEMGITDVKTLCDELEKLDYYQILFTQTFGTSEITPEKMSLALVAFVQSIQSQTQFIDTSTFAPLEGEEKHGAELFFTKYDCNSCHMVQDPHGYVEAGTFANIGLETEYVDNGLGEITRFAGDNGKFKIPSLRNVALTAPYMHDGRFATLEEAIGHYSDKIQDHPNLDVRLRNDDGTARVFSISEEEKHAIVAFLGTMTDHQMISDPKFSDPFKR
jgi:cytochrome c peroxidase